MQPSASLAALTLAALTATAHAGPGCCPGCANPERNADGHLVTRGIVGADGTCRAPTELELQTILQLEAVQARSNEPRVMASLGRFDGARSGLDIQYSLSSSAASDPEFVAALENAAQIWESIIRDNATLVMEVDIGNVGGAIAATQRFADSADYLTVRNALVNNATPSEFDLISALPTSPAPSFDYGDVIYRPDDPDDGQPNRIEFSIAQAQALGFGDLTSGNNPDSRITFSSTLNFDNVPDNVNIGFDTSAVMVHELGHALGFVSGGDGGFPTVWDLFRVGTGSSPSNPANLAEFATVVRILSPFGAPALDTVGEYAGFIDANLPLARGVSSTEGDQASHWRDDRFGLNIGVMDPRYNNNVNALDPLSDADILAISLMGWNVAVIPEDIVPAPEPFDLLTPPDDATDLDIPVTLSWEASANADFYEVFVIDTTTPAFVIFTTTTDTSLVLDDTLLSPGLDYAWEVTAINAATEVLSTPEAGNFSTAPNDDAISCDDIAGPGGTVGPNNLFNLLAAFGTNNPTSDFDNDGTVGPDDLFALLSFFGQTCP